MATTTRTIPSPANGGVPGLHLPRVRAVVVDDSPEMACLIQSCLEYTSRVENIGTANNGRQGVEIVDSLRPDLVVMDVNMPVMNGFLATAEIKNLLPDTRVLVVSADDDPEVASTALESGADDFIPKTNLQMLSYHVARLFPERFRLA